MTATPPMTGSVPQHAPGARLVELPTGAELQDASASHRIVVDDTALALWDVCDGETSVAEMVDAVCAIFSGDPEVIAVDVRRTLDALAAAGLIDWSSA